MKKVSVILVIYNAKRYIKPVFDAIFAQTHINFEVIAVVNGNEDGSKELITQGYPKVKIIDPGANLWFAKGNNLAIAGSEGDFVLLVNQDLILEPDYMEKVLYAFHDPKVGAATGKLLRYDFAKNEKTNIIDSTGVTMSSAGRGKDRGQLEEDRGQYDGKKEIFGVSGAGPMYRRAALEEAKFCENYQCEYFDEDFVAYWEDVDLSWRLNHTGYKNVYVPEAVAYHGRTAGQAEGGYLHLWHFIKHHQQLPPLFRRLNYQNHIFTYLKNAKVIHPMFVLREIVMLGYVLVFETSTLKVLLEMFRLWPRMRKKRRYILG